MITLEHVCKIYGKGDNKKEALKDINLTIQDGELVAIMGTSGSGKTTLLNMIGAMDSISSGCYKYQTKERSIEVDKLKNQGLHMFRKENVSFVFQQFALMNHYTVYENVEMPLRIRNLSKKQRRKMVMEQLEKMHIADLAKKWPVQISGGQQQRCAIARALVQETDLLLADEPTGALDHATGTEIMNLLKEINDEGKTVIIVTHDPEIAACAKRIVRIEDGKLVSDEILNK